MRFATLPLAPPVYVWPVDAWEELVERERATAGRGEVEQDEERQREEAAQSREERTMKALIWNKGADYTPGLTLNVSVKDVDMGDGYTVSGDVEILNGNRPDIHVTSICLDGVACPDWIAELLKFDHRAKGRLLSAAVEQIAAAWRKGGMDVETKEN